MNVIHFPLPPDTSVDDAELAQILSRTCAGLLIDNERLEAQVADLVVDEAVAQSWAASFQLRLEAIQVRRLRWLAWGMAAGGTLALILDGTLARWLA